MAAAAAPGSQLCDTFKDGLEDMKSLPIRQMRHIKLTDNTFM